MPIKKDDAGRRRVEMEFIAPGTPEQVWEAMATGRGNTAWFTKAAIEERAGGRMEFDMGEMGTQAAEVTAWEPPHRFGYVERDWSEGAPPVATEITITARSGDRCVVRMVHSLFSTSDDWDDQEGFEKGWPAFFEVLRLYLAHFPGQPAASFTAMTSVAGDHLAAWKRLIGALDLSGVDAGDTRVTPAEPEALSGVVERIVQAPEQRYLLMRLARPALGVGMIGTYRAGPQVIASTTFYFYGSDAEGRASVSARLWRDWLRTHFATEAAESARR